MSIITVKDLNKQKYTMERNETKIKKDVMITRINSLHYTPKDFNEKQLSYTGWIFRGNYPDPDNNDQFIEDAPQMCCDFCLKCGNYQYTSYGTKPDNIVCCCKRTLQKPLSWSSEWRQYWQS